MLKRMGTFIANRPLVAMAAVLILTAALFSAYIFKGMESRMNEKDFTPDVKESQADREISEKFTSAYTLTIFVRSEDKTSSIITPDAMVDALELEEKLYSDEEVREYLKSSSQQDILSAADLLAQFIITGKLMGALENYSQQMFNSLLSSLNSTFDRYAAMGLVEDPNMMLQNIETLMLIRLPAVENSTMEAFTNQYTALLPSLTSNLTIAIDGVLTLSFANLNESLLSLNLSSMSGEEAANAVNETFNAFMPSLLQNLTPAVYGTLFNQLEHVILTTVMQGTEGLSALLGEALGYTFGEALKSRMENLSYSLNTIMESLPGEGGENTTGPGPQEIMMLVNRTVQDVVQNVSTSMGEGVAEILNDTISAVVQQFTGSLNENLTIHLIPPLEGTRMKVLENLTSSENITISLMEGRAHCVEIIPTILNNSMVLLSGGFENTHLNLSPVAFETLEDGWPGVYSILNQTYLGLIETLRGEAMEMFSTQTAGGTPAVENMTEFMSIMNRLTYRDKMTVFRGGRINISLMGMDVNLSFTPMSQAGLESIIRETYLHPSPESLPLIMTMNGTFTREFNPPEEIRSVGMMISLYFSNELNSNKTLSEKIERRVNSLVKSYNSESKGVVFTTVGMTIISDKIMESSFSSMRIILVLALVAVVLILLLVYRGLYDLIISLSALAMAILWTYGFGSLLGYIFNPLLIAVPVLIVGLGIDFGIHLIMRYRAEREEGESVEKSTERTVNSVGMALLLATFTTVVAFLSNAISPIPALSQFGVLCALGIISSFVIMLTFVPAARVLRDRKRERSNEPGKKSKTTRRGGREKSFGSTLLERGLTLGAVGSERHPMVVLSLALILTGAGFYTYTQLPTKFDVKDFLPEEIPLARELRFMLEEYNFEDITEGNVNILIKGDVASVDLLKSLKDAQDNMGDSRGVVKEGSTAKVNSILTLMEDYATFTPGGSDYRYNRTFSEMYHNVMGNDMRPLPNATDSDVLKLYNWLYENAMTDATGVLHRSQDGRYDATVMRVEVSVRDRAEEIYRLRSDLINNVEPVKKTEGIEDVVVTSGPILSQIITDTLNRSEINSIIITFTVSLLALGLVYYFVERSFILGVITTLPMLFCMSWLFGSMYILGIPLNVLTITIASLTVGLGITYGIHMSHRFAEDLREVGDPERAMRRSVTHVGSALFGAAATTIAGFGLLVFALLPPIKQFGGMTALAILFSFLSSVFVLPSVLMPWARRVCKEKCTSVEEKMEE